MFSDKTVYHFGTCWVSTIFVHIGISYFCRSLETLTVFGTKAISKQIPLSDQNIFSTDVCNLLNYQLQLSDCIKPVHIKLICFFEQLNTFFLLN